jgi:hypothetical protein
MLLGLWDRDFPGAPGKEAVREIENFLAVTPEWDHDIPLQPEIVEREAGFFPSPIILDRILPRSLKVPGSEGSPALELATHAREQFSLGPSEPAPSLFRDFALHDDPQIRQFLEWANLDVTAHLKQGPFLVERVFQVIGPIADNSPP